MLEGLRGEQSISELCRREGIAANLYYRWSKDFLEAGKKQLAGDTVREATSDEVKALRSENRELKEVVAEITLKNRVLKKSLTGLVVDEAVGALVDAWRSLLSRPGRRARMAAAAHARARSAFAPERLASEVDAFYRELL